MRTALVLVLLLCGCRGADVPLEYDGRVPPSQMDSRQWSRFVAQAGIQADARVKTFTPTWTGFGVAPVGDLSYMDFSTLVAVWRDTALVGASNATTMTITNLPEAIRPTSDFRYVLCAITDDGALNSGAVILDDTGEMEFAVATVGAAPGKVVNNPSGFTNPAFKGLPSGWIILYAR